MYGSTKIGSGLPRFGAYGAAAALVIAAAIGAAYYYSRSQAADSSGASNDQAAPAANSQAFGWLTGIWDAIQDFGADIGVASPRGVRNNNPGNLEFNAGINWVGQVGADAAGYLIFDTAEHGARALGHDLATAIGEGYNTVDALIEHFAPAADNPATASGEYQTNVAKAAGIARDQTISTVDATWIAGAVATQELGPGPWTAPNGLQYSAADVSTWAGEA